MFSDDSQTHGPYRRVIIDGKDIYIPVHLLNIYTYDRELGALLT